MATVSEIQIALVPNADKHNDRILAFASLVLDGCYCVRDIKIVQADDGSAFVCMPNRKMTDRCTYCSAKNHLKARYCNDCGERLDDYRAARDNNTKRLKLYADVFFPINADCRTDIAGAVLQAWEGEKKRNAS